MSERLPNFEELKDIQVASKKFDIYSCEYVTGEDGKPVLTKVSFQRKREFAFKLFSVFAVFIAFVGLIANFISQSRQTANQIKQQRTAIQLADFTKLRGNIDIMVNKDRADSEFYDAEKKINLDIMPELEMISDTPFLSTLHRFINMCYTYQQVDNLNAALENIPSATNAMFMSKGKFEIGQYNDLQGFTEDLRSVVDGLTESENYLGLYSSKIDTSRLLPSLRLLGYKDDRIIRKTYHDAGIVCNQIFVKTNTVYFDFVHFNSLASVNANNIKKSLSTLEFRKEIPEISNYQFRIDSISKTAMSWLRKERPNIVKLIIAENPVLRNK
jgi:hypothetical protein